MKTSYRFGLVGHNIGYSRSPDIFRTICDIKNLDGAFENFDIAPAELSERLPAVLASGLDGLSVTTPYKQQVISYLDDIDPVADAIDAVNSVMITESSLYGFNTDCYGFALPLHEYASALKRGTAIILGAGGAARAVVYALYTDFEIGRFIVAGRGVKKLSLFRRSLLNCIPNIRMETMRLREETLENESYDIVINCTPLGGANHASASPLSKDFKWRPGKIYYDLNYNPDNRLVARARANGLIAFDGSAMLVGQAVRSFYLWTERSVEFRPVYRAVFGDLPDTIK